jgi:hypothetical protein
LIQVVLQEMEQLPGALWEVQPGQRMLAVGKGNGRMPYLTTLVTAMQMLLNILCTQALYLNGVDDQIPWVSSIQVGNVSIGIDGHANLYVQLFVFCLVPTSRLILPFDCRTCPRA